MNRRMLWVSLERADPVVTVVFKGRLCSETLGNAFTKLEQQSLGDGMEVRFDLKEIELIDSSGIGAIIRWHRHLREKNIRLKLTNVCGEVSRTLKLCNLANLIEIEEYLETTDNKEQRNGRLLWRSHRYAEQVLAALGEGLIGLNENCRVLYVNPCMEEILGVPESEMIGKVFCDVAGFKISKCSARNTDECNIGQLLGEEQVYRDEVFLRTGTETKPMALTMRAIYEPQDQGPEKLVGAVAGFADISDRYRAQTAEREAARMEATSTLAAGIAHDFNNLMFGVIGNAEMLKLDLRDNQEACKILEEICSVGRRASELSQQMLAYAQGGRSETVEIDLGKMVAEVVQEIKESAPTPVEFRLQQPSDLHAISGDLSQIRQIIRNLVVNSVESFEESGQVLLTMENIASEKEVPVAIKLKPGPMVRISIQDNGCGMDQATCGRIFEPFFSTKFIGRGLGLAAVDGIVRNHGGVILVKSQPNEGTTFDVYLPSMGMPPKVSVKRFSGELNAPFTVLIIDDEEMVRRLSRLILERQGYQVLECEDAQSALMISEEHEGDIHVALLDLSLSGINGAQLIQPLKASRPDIKIIVCSGLALENGNETLAELGVTDFLPKPFNPETLNNIVARMLADAVTSRQ